MSGMYDVNLHNQIGGLVCTLGGDHGIRPVSVHVVGLSCLGWTASLVVVISNCKKSKEASA